MKNRTAPPSAATKRDVQTFLVLMYAWSFPNQLHQEKNVMDTFLHKHAGNVIGVLNVFDRLVFRGALRRLVFLEGMKSYLWAAKVLLKDFGEHVDSSDGPAVLASDTD